ncbi:UNVERIFIED_CONTAM: hypothetical protein RMT77_019578 [Armadillidium vulgare]
MAKMLESIDLDIPSYDLKQDLLNEELKSLKNIAMVYASASFYKKEDITEEIHQIWEAVIKSDISFYEENWKILMRKVENKFHDTFHSPNDEIKEQICIMSDFVGKQIFKFFSKEISPKEIPLFIRNFVFTSQGTINTYKTVIRILDEEDMTKEFKFSFACKYFTEENRIRDYLYDLSEPVQQWLKQLDALKEYSFTPLYYWSNKIIGKKKMKINLDVDSKKRSNEDSKIKKQKEYHLFKWALLNKNDTAVQYLWENLVSSSKMKEAILSDLSCELVKFGNQNIFVFLLQKTTDFSLEWFSEHSHAILRQLLTNCRWKNRFAKIAEYLESRFRFLNTTIIKEIISLIQKSKNPSQERDEYCEILQDCLLIIPTQNYVKSLIDIILDENFYDMLFPVINEKKTKLFKKICDIMNRKNLSHKFLNCSRTFFHAVVLKEDFNFIEVVLEDISNSQKEYLKNKEDFSTKTAFGICDSLLNNNEWESLNKLITWFSKFYSKYEINRLKHSVLYNFNSTLLRKIITKGAGLPYIEYPSKSSQSLSLKLNEEIVKPASEKEMCSDALLKLDKLLSWSLGSEEEIKKFKSLCFEVCNPLEVSDSSKEIQKLLIELILNGKTFVVDELLIWSRFSKFQIQLYKRDLPRDSVTMLAFIKENRLIEFFKYIEWCEKVDYNV